MYNFIENLSFVHALLPDQAVTSNIPSFRFLCNHGDIFKHVINKSTLTRSCENVMFWVHLPTLERDFGTGILHVYNYIQFGVLVINFKVGFHATTHSHCLVSLLVYTHLVCILVCYFDKIFIIILWLMPFYNQL